MANASILAAFERMWQHVLAVIGNKADATHTHDDTYYTKTELNDALTQKSQVQIITWEDDD